MFLRILWRLFSREPKKKMLAVVTVAFGTSLGTAMLSLNLDVGDKVSRELRSYGANLMVVPREAALPVEIEGLDVAALEGREFLDEEDLAKIKTIFWRHNILGFAPYLDLPATDVRGWRVAVLGTWFDRRIALPTGETFQTGIRKIRPWWQVEGEWVDDGGEGQSEALVGKRVASSLSVMPGGRIELVFDGPGGRVTRSLPVAGVVTTGDEDENRVFVPLRFAQEISGLPGKVGKFEASAVTTPDNDLARKARRDLESLTRLEYLTWYCTPYVDSIAFQIEEVVAGAKAKPLRQVSEAEGQVMSKIQMLMLLFTLAGFVSSAIGVSSLMTTKVLERAKEIGLLKALGASSEAVGALFLAEAMMEGLAGGLAGYAVGLGFAQAVSRQVFGAPVEMKAVVLPVMLLASLAVTVLGSLSAVKTILGLRPAGVLHGE